MSTKKAAVGGPFAGMQGVTVTVRMYVSTPDDVPAAQKRDFIRERLEAMVQSNSAKVRLERVDAEMDFGGGAEPMRLFTHHNADEN